MPYLVWDSETYKLENGKLVPILNASGKYFTLGCTLKDNGCKKAFYDRIKMREYIIEEGEKAYKRGKKLHVFGFNSRYEFFNIMNLKDPNIRFFSENPFIASYMKEVKKEFNSLEKLKKWMYYAKIEKIRYKMEEIEGVYYVTYKKEIIKFGDVMSIYRMSLKRMGEIIGVPKQEMPTQIEGIYKTKANLKVLEEYCHNDCKVTMEGIKKIKTKLKEDGVNIRNLCTINQIAINYVMNEIRKRDNEDYLIRGKDGKALGITYKTKYANEIHQAYRASLNRVWDVGEFDNVCFSDKNCYSADTEILTKNGFKKYNEIVKGEDVLTMNSKEELEYNPIKEIIIDDYNGNFISIESENVDLKVTPNHRVYYYKRKQRKNDKKCSGVDENNLFISEAKDVPLTYIKIPCARKYKQGKVKNNPYLIKLLGWIITESSYQRKNNTITIYQSSQRNNEYANEIEECLKKLNINYTKKGKNKCVNHNTCWEFTLKRPDIAWIREICPNKQIQRDWLNNWCQKDLNILFWTMMKGDGSFRYQKKTTFVQKGKEGLDLFQELCLKIGKKSIVRYDGLGKKKDCGIVQIKNNRNGNSSISNYKKTHQYNTKRNIKYNGKIWCVNVENSNIVIRRNGKICISGNSLYPYAITQIKMPDLRTEKKVEKPDINILNEIGISKVMLYNKFDDIGLIPIRAIEKSYVPLQGKYIIGVYTNMEILEAINNGYEIMGIEWSIIYKEGKNIFKDIYKDLYRKRMEDNNEFNRFFYKQIMNSSLGKFGQRRVNQELCIDSIENIEEYLKLKGEIIKGIDGTHNVLYKLVLDDKPKKYYAPIIPCLVTAYSRIYMYRMFKMIGKSNLLYTDTDSLITKNNHIPYLKIGNQLEDWKIEKDNKTGEELTNAKAIIWGSKAKSVGNNITVSGAFKSDLKMEDFKKGVVNSQKMMGIKNNRNEEVGKIIKDKKDLNKQKENFIKTEKLLGEEILYIDKNVDDVSFFIKNIKEVLDNEESIHL